MARQVQLRRGTTSEHSTFTGAVGEITVDTDKDTVVVHDGSTAGGHALVPTASPTITGTATISGLTYPTSDGTNGQVLTTDGAGALSFSTISGYTDSDVDTHLNTGTATTGQYLSWNGSDYDWATVSTTVAIDDLTDGTNDGSSVGLGSGALSNDDGTTNSNTAVGTNSQTSVTSGAYNTSIGGYNLQFNTTGSGSTAVGYQALQGVSGNSHHYNVGVGWRTGKSITTGTYNTLVGPSTGLNLTTGDYNSALGVQALYSNTTGEYNAAVGQNAIQYNVTGLYNTAIGAEALRGTSGSSQARNTAIGYQSMLNVGTNADQNTAVGERSLNTISTGTENTAIGAQAGYSLTTGQNNVFIGAVAGSNTTTGTNNICIGKSVQNSDPTVSNEIVLGKSTHDRLLIGGFGTSANDGKALVWDDTANTFTMASAGGYHSVYDSVTFSSATSGVDFTQLPAGDYRIIGSNLEVSTSTEMTMKLFDTSNNQKALGQNGTAYVWSYTGGANQSRYNVYDVRLNEGQAINPSYSKANFIIDIFGINDQNTRPSGFYKISGRKAANDDDGWVCIGGFGTSANTPINKINIDVTNGTLNSGTIQLLKLS